jgi:hypothetical protein
MVANHLTRGHPQQSARKNLATFHNIPTDFISSRQWILVVQYPLLISRGNGNNQANCFVGCVLRPQGNQKG